MARGPEPCAQAEIADAVIERSGPGYSAAEVSAFLARRVQESSRLDYKADPGLWPSSDKRTHADRLAAMVVKAVCAMANADGGTLFLGVGEDADGYPLATTPPGLPSELGGPIVERIDRMITRHVVPRPPATVSSVATEVEKRAYVLVDIAPRAGGPYRVRDTKDPSIDDRYFVRQGRSSNVADHDLLRELFAEAAEDLDVVRMYHAARGLDTPDSRLRPPASLICNEGRRAAGLVVVTITPEALRRDVVNVDSPAIRATFNPDGELGATFGSTTKPTSDGRSLEERSGSDQLRSYFELHRNGYIEASHAKTYALTDRGQFVNADAVVAVLRPLLGAAQAIYEAALVSDRISVALHVRGAVGDKLGRPITGGGLTGKGRSDRGAFTIAASFDRSELATPATLAQMDQRLANAFGIEDGLVLFPDGRKRPDVFYFGD